MHAGRLDLTQPLVWTVDDTLSPVNCEAYIRRTREDPLRTLVST